MSASALLAGPSLQPKASSPVYLIDASVFIFRAFFSVPVTLTDPDGRPVNAVHGFARFIGDLIESVRPTHLAVAFDESLVTSFRSKLYPPYKANREPAPEELKQQFRLCREFCEAFGLAAFSSTEYEADDVIGTLAKRARDAGVPVVIVTRDKDLAQLVGAQDEFWDYVADVRYAYEDIEERFGVVPECIADFLALTGDAVDNIRGVPGIGRKTASMLLKHFHSLEQLYANLDRVPALKVRNAGFVTGQLNDHREAAFLARQLTGIYCDMPFKAQLEDMRRRPLSLEHLERFYDSVGFGRLLRNQAERIAACSRSTEENVGE